MAGNDTMPIRIPISMDSNQLTDDEVKASAALNRTRTTMRSMKQDADGVSKSMEGLVNENKRLTERQDSLTKKLAELTKQYQEGEKAVNRDAEAQFKLAQKIAQTENQLRTLDTALTKNSLAQYTQDTIALEAEINRLTQSVNTEAAQLRIAGQETEALNVQRDGARLRAELQAQRVDTLRIALQRATTAEGQGSKVVGELSKKYNIASDELLKMTRGLDQNTEAIKQQSEAMEQADTGTGELMAGMVGTELTAKRIGDALTNNVTKPLFAYGKQAVEASIANDAMEQSFTRTFDKSAEGARRWSQALSDSMQVSEYRVRDMMTTQKVLLTSLEVDTKNQGKLIEEAMSRLYDMAALMDSDVATAFEKYRSGLVGSSKPLLDWGVDLRATSVEAFALANNIGTVGQELTEQEKVLARHGLFMRQTSQAQGMWNEEADTTSGRLKTNAERIDELEKKLGAALTPVLEKLLGIVEPFLDWVSGLNEGTLQMVAVMGMLVAILGPLIQMLTMIKQLQFAQTMMGMSSSAGVLTGTLTTGLLPILLKVGAAIAVIAGIGAGLKKAGNWFWDQGSPEQQQILIDRINSAAQANRDAYNPPSWLQFNARGTSYYTGGPTVLDEEGPEVIDLPQGTRIYPAAQSKRMMGSGGGRGGDVYLIVEWERVKDLTHLVETAHNAQRLARQKG